MSLPLTFWAKIWLWVKKKWEWVVGLIVGLITLLSVLIRSRQQKKVLEAANKAHEKENKINEKAKNDLSEGLTKIAEEKDEKIKDAVTEFDKKEKELQEEKEKFVDEASNSDDLAKKIADHLGVEYVDADDE